MRRVAQRLRQSQARLARGVRVQAHLVSVTLIRGDAMADKGNQSFAGTDEERQRETTGESGHASHERGAAHEYNTMNSNDSARRGGENNEAGSEHRARRTRGGTHDQHVTAGKKGGSRIRQLIELGYKYEQEHGIGPGQNERSKLAAKRRASKSDSTEGGGSVHWWVSEASTAR